MCRREVFPCLFVLPSSGVNIILGYLVLCFPFSVNQTWFKQANLFNDTMVYASINILLSVLNSVDFLGWTLHWSCTVPSGSDQSHPVQERSLRNHLLLSSLFVFIFCNCDVMCCVFILVFYPCDEVRIEVRSSMTGCTLLLSANIVHLLLLMLLVALQGFEG